MVTRDGFAKILDFGLAKLTQPEETGGATTAPTVSGATRARARDRDDRVHVARAGARQARRLPLGPVRPGLDPLRDGDGQAGLLARQRAETLTAIIRDEPEPLVGLAPLTPAPLRWIVERCLAKNPDDRYASTRDLARDLATLRDRLPEATAAGPGGGRAGPRRPPLRGPCAPSRGGSRCCSRPDWPGCCLPARGADGAGRPRCASP